MIRTIEIKRNRICVYDEFWKETRFYHTRYLTKNLIIFSYIKKHFFKYIKGAIIILMGPFIFNGSIFLNGARVIKKGANSKYLWGQTQKGPKSINLGSILNEFRAMK